MLVCNTLANHCLTSPTKYRGSGRSGLPGPVRLEIARPASAAASARQDAAGGRPLRSVAPGERAVLWHQGESDAIAGTSSDNYARMLGEIIVRSRKDAGYAVAWGVAPASFHPDPQATIANQQAVGRRWSRPLLAVSAPGGVG